MKIRANCSDTLPKLIMAASSRVLAVAVAVAYDVLIDSQHFV